MKNLSRRLCFYVAFWVLSGPLCATGSPINVFAAASLKEAMDEAAIGFEQGHAGQSVRVVYAGSADLARQIEQGAPADLVLTADTQWMDYLQQRNLIDPARRLDLLGNQLVVIAPNTGPAESLTVADAESWQEWLGEEGRLALANVASVPAGRYAQAALESVKVWDKLQSRTVQSDNVRGALLLVARAETPLGIVYATDALVEPQVRVVARIAGNLHPPIVYVLARCIHAPAGGAADQLYEYLRGDQAAEVFRSKGFEVLRP